VCLGGQVLACSPRFWEEQCASCRMDLRNSYIAVCLLFLSGTLMIGTKSTRQVFFLNLFDSSQNYWVSGRCSSSGIVNTIKHSVSKTGPASVLR
jgi:hypothetical protein